MPSALLLNFTRKYRGLSRGDCAFSRRWSTDRETIGAIPRKNACTPGHFGAGGQAGVVVMDGQRVCTGIPFFCAYSAAKLLTGVVMLVSLLQPEKALLSMLVTQFGMEMPLRLL